MIPNDARVLVAVSGGIDSIVLLDVLVRLSVERSFELVVGHIDHGLRGAASAGDSAFVERLADAYHLPFVNHHLMTSDIEEHRAQGREGATRNARLFALKQMACAVHASRIALAHTLDDHAETILYHLARGAGPTGLRGIAPIRLPFIRPLIQTSRAQVHDYAISQSLEWREDATNADSSFSRNRIRHHVLPELRALNPRVAEALARNADLLADLDEATAFLLREQMPHWIVNSEDATLAWSRSRLVGLPKSVLQLALRDGIQQVRGHLNGISRSHIDALAKLVLGTQAHADLSLPGIHAGMQGNTLTLQLHPPKAMSGWNLTVDLGETPLPDEEASLDLQIVPVADVDWEAARTSRWVEIADADGIAFPLHVRTRAPGDRFAPLGLGHEIKLKDFLMNAHTSVFDRDRIPLLCDNQRILWVVGIRLSDTVKLSEETNRVLVMKIKGVR
ncbi:tRNA lysidine(34) synthetase TilS [Candidatus Bipolaricaulota bacterium]|nr:tRNA lysidine(34) synthetase TilS [Candidatus Bipolaricaulota bacterium]